MEKIRIGICGYGNLGRGIERALEVNDDMEGVGIFSRRDPAKVKTVFGKIPVYSIDELDSFYDKIDVLIICMGSATDLPVITPRLAEKFNVVDSFDNHAKIPEHFNNVNNAALKGGKVALISAGWDPGLFSMNRLLGEAVLPRGKTNTFWGRGISQGHSDAIRRIEGVEDARQYTIPIEKTVKEVRDGSFKDYTKREKHLRECFVVAKEGYDKKKIERKIVTMPDYFADYDTVVNFITKEELERDHKGMPHGGFVIRGGETGEGNKEVMEFSLNLASNPEFTSSVLVSFARAVNTMSKLKEYGAKTVFDVRPRWLSKRSDEEIIREIL